MKRINPLLLIVAGALCVALLAGCQKSSSDAADTSDDAGTEMASHEHDGHAHDDHDGHAHDDAAHAHDDAHGDEAHADGDHAGHDHARAADPPKTSAPTPAPSGRKAPAEVTIKAGTIIKARLDQDIASHQSKTGDAVTLTVSEPIVVAGYRPIPAGARVMAVVANAKESGKIDGRGEITLAFKSIVDANGKEHSIVAPEFNGKAEGSGDRDAAMIAGGAVAGAIIGGIVGDTKGAAIGGLIGGAAGTGTVLATKGPEIKITQGSEFGIKINKSLYMPPGAPAE